MTGLEPSTPNHKLVKTWPKGVSCIYVSSPVGREHRPGVFVGAGGGEAVFIVLICAHTFQKGYFITIQTIQHIPIEGMEVR